MPDLSSSKPTSGRLLSLDVFRGATVAGMMLVNNPGDWGQIYAPFKHAAWNGWTFTDLIFPFFLWIVGVAMTFSNAKRIERGDDRSKLLMHAFRRALIIFGLGIFLAGFPKLIPFFDLSVLSTIRIPGVLQRIAVCYFISSLILLYSDIVWQIRWTVILLAFYWLAVKLIPVPGYGEGIFDPTGNLCWYIDSTWLQGHTWSGAPVPGFDPEGIFSTIPAIATTMFGILTGHILRTQKTQNEKTILMFVLANVLLFAGVVMDNWLPINKNLWTSSYSVFMAGMALNMFAFCYWLIDVKGSRWWTKPWEIYGLNAITMFVLAGMVGRLLVIIKLTGGDGDPVALKTVLYKNLYLSIADPMNASLLFALTFVVFLYLIAYLMYRFKWIIKV